MSKKFTPADFWAKVQKSESCWLWVGHINDRGYGRASYQGRMHQAHRLAYELAIGPIPNELVLDHLCRVRNCVNPDHLQPVTNRENVLRGISRPAVNAVRTHCERGHEFTEENTYWWRDGRQCRACKAEYNREKRKRAALAKRDDCLHPGRHVRGLPCPDCGRYSSHSWSTDWYQTFDGNNQQWGGVCSKHGDWSESAA